jgi:KUP system potassium uptake protein
MSTVPARQSLAALSLAAIGVVFGDIGTSPLYTLKEVFSEANGVALNTANILGAVSSIFWALMLVVTLKYVILVLRADNRGEGGIMALLALAITTSHNPQRKTWLLALGTFGATLFYGDSIITPAISVLSAVEGLELVTPDLKPYILPSSVAILIALFMVQKHGTAMVGRFFGPIIVVWFTVLGAVGLYQITFAPQILQALNPLVALGFLADRGPMVFLALGAIVLALTGAEALYADMGHFGRKSIQLSWTFLVMPGLALNYLGQGASLLSNPKAVENPFYYAFPEFLLLPAVILSTLATIIASQAVITGAYSMTQQAIHLGLLPRMHIVHTSSTEVGQIYMPIINWILLLAVIVACISFGSSTALASAYGIAVTATMLITTLLTFVVVRYRWHYPLWVAILSTSFFAVVDALLLISCSFKFLQGGWFPVVLGLALFVVMWTWKQGRELLMIHIREDDPKLLDFVANLQHSNLSPVDRTAVYLVSDPQAAPQALLHNIKHNMTLHKKNLVVTVNFGDAPYVDEASRMQMTAIGHGFWQISLQYGFMDQPDIPKALALCHHLGFDWDPFMTSYFVSRETVVPTPGKGMAFWREELFAAMSRNAGSVVGYFNLPSNCVIELGTRVHI